MLKHVLVNTGTGDIIVDMGNQVKANTIRIQLLETQNDGLRNSISKLQQLQYQQPPEQSFHNMELPVNQDKWAAQIQVTCICICCFQIHFQYILSCLCLFLYSPHS